MMRQEQRIAESRTNSEEHIGFPSSYIQRKYFNNGNIAWHLIIVRNFLDSEKNCTVISVLSNHSHGNGFIYTNGMMSPNLKKRSKHIQKLNMGQAEDDIHVCIKCLRALMNNKVKNQSSKNCRHQWLAQHYYITM